MHNIYYLEMLILSMYLNVATLEKKTDASMQFAKVLWLFTMNI